MEKKSASLICLFLFHLRKYLDYFMEKRKGYTYIKGSTAKSRTERKNLLMEGVESPIIPNK